MICFLLFCLGYILMAGIIYAISYFYFKKTSTYYADEDAFFCALGWPATLFFAPIYFLRFGIKTFIDARFDK